MKKILSSILLFTLLVSCKSQKTNLLDIIDTDHPKLKSVFQQPDKFELQIRYTQIDRDAANYPFLKTYDYRVDSNFYFYPASTVKMPTAFLALQRIAELEVYYPVSKESRIEIDSVRLPQSRALIDTTSATGFPSIGHYIHKLFVVSDNDAYNRLYEFLGQDYINQELKKLEAFGNSRIVTRVGISGFDSISNRYTNPVRLLNGNELAFHQSEKISIGNYLTQIEETRKGKAWVNGEGSTVNTPFDMSAKNFISIQDLEGCLQRVVFPQLFKPSQRYSMSNEDLAFILTTMSRLPSESLYPKYDTSHYYDSYSKYFIYGDSTAKIPKNVRIFNKIGLAYGYMTDCAYIVDFEKGIEFFLTTTLLVNENQTFNDNQYEYDEIGFPFFAELGRQIMQYEEKRQKPRLPDFSMLKRQIGMQ